TYTRPIAEITLGILSIREKWLRRLPEATYCWITADYLSEKFPSTPISPAPADKYAPLQPEGATLAVNGNIVPSDTIIAEIMAAAERSEGKNLELKAPGGKSIGTLSMPGAQPDAECVQYTLSCPVVTIEWVYDIFLKNFDAIADDYALITKGRKSAPLDPSCCLIGDPSQLFIEEGASVTGAIINVTGGPVYIASAATVMEGVCMRGPIAMCEHSQANMGTKIYGGTTLGIYCKVGGELNNVVMLGYSNKAHDGFLGNAVIGQWCNLGAGCVASNLKNDYTEIKLWNYPAHRFLRTGLQFCGLIMGDHSKAGINAMFNTASVIGVGVNIHGAGFPRNFVASFQEGSAAGFTDVPMAKFIDTARRMMARRSVELTDADIRMFDAIRHIADDYK
ncbi:MAG: glucose-1-phosphate thymidylyltransferase, partial [Muribaculaceae bacterium]|nr:glucose-1-phosphate thymidylyltransferase [Muribaculaceae bacterium]